MRRPPRSPSTLPRPAALILLALSFAAVPIDAQDSALSASAPPVARTHWLRAAKVLPMTGEVLEDGEVLVVDGKIRAVGKGLGVPEGAQRHEFPSAWITPGFVELHCHVGVSGGDINDSVMPHNMDLRTLDLILQDSPELDRAVRAGVTTALIIPGSGSSIGGLGALVKTAGPTFDDRLIRFPGALKIALHARGGNPSRRGGDLGAHRLGLHAMLKITMAEARDYHVAWLAHEDGGASKPDFNPRLDPLRGLFRREFPCILHAYGQNDTMTSIRILKWGLDLPMVISHGVYDSFKIGKELAATGVPMNIGPRQYEFDEARFIGNAGSLHGSGVDISICTDAPVVAQDQLQLQAAMAVRLGMPDRAALRGLTIVPARQIGIDDRVGSIEPGKDADLVVWNGDPLDPRNAPTWVMVDGRVVAGAR